MKWIKFDEQTKTLEKPEGWSDKECGSLPVFNDGKQCISCWKFSFRERWRVLFCGRIWLSVVFGKSQPPVWLSVNYPFEKKEEKRWRVRERIKKLLKRFLAGFARSKKSTE